ncbi:MAG TPA: ATP-binding protein, partial [Polyangia bacterium]|nr:ATP-binding protein [Polyangia bacterium]
AREASGARRPPEPAPWKIVISAWGSVPPPDPSDPLLRRLGAEAPLLTREAVAQGILSDVRTQAERMFARYGAEALLALAVRRDLRPSGPDARVTSADSGPRWASGRVLGLLAVGPRPGGQPFSDLELDFLDRVRTHTAAALVQARLYERLYRLKLELEEKVAARTQELARAARGLESAQQQLVESEKMSMLGLLVSGVAPDLLSAVESAHGAVPKLIAHLAALQVALDLCRDAAGEVARSELAPREAAARLDYVRRDLGALVDAIAEGARRATAIAQDLRRFARADAAERHQADLHAGIESTLNLLRHELRGGRVRIERDFDPDIPPLECYPGPLNQVFMNLLLNATQAIDDTGTIVIRTRRVDPDRVEVTVRDSGKGIPREHLSRIFEPFFTTKSQGGRSGSGLGLAISYGIVQRHGGRITVESEEGKGTEFRVQLPIRAPGLPPPGSRLPS